MTDEQLEKYYDIKRKYNGCILKDSQCPLKDHCNGLVRNKCKEYVPSEYLCCIQLKTLMEMKHLYAHQIMDFVY